MDGEASPLLAGVIEGFYGPPWDDERRLEVLAACAAGGMTHYVWAPKDDRKHRADWRIPYDDPELARFERLVRASGLTVAFGVSPGLSIDYAAPSDRFALLDKVRQVTDLGVAIVVLCLDDLPVRPGLGEDHAKLTAWLCDELAGTADVWLVPTEYTGVRATPYLDTVACGVPAEVPIGWTGPYVVCDRITVADVERRTEALGGRRPLLWENFPVNDGMMADRLFLGPYRGRDAELREHLWGLLANPMVQPRASMLPLASVAAWCRGDDATAAWEAAADELDWRIFADACAGELPAALGDPELDDWLDAAHTCTAPGIEDEVGPWLEQVRAEAALARKAVRLWRAVRAPEPDPEQVVALALAVAFDWQQAKRSAVNVFGTRCSLRPALDQDDAGRWRWHPSALAEGDNAVDTLVRAALSAAAG